MRYPCLKIDINKIYHNAHTIVNMCKDSNVSVWGVTKVFCGDPGIARVMVDAGVSTVADSRISNLRKLYANGFDNLVLLRIPMLSEIYQVVEYADICLISEIATLIALDKAARSVRKRQKVVLMIDIGDLREGIFYKNALNIISSFPQFDNVEIAGIGTNLTCYGGVIPKLENLLKLTSLANQLRSKFRWDIPIVSGGNSSSLGLVLQKKIFKQINNLRIGEGIILGRETIAREPIPNTYQDACLIEAEIVEIQHKPSVPKGDISQDAFGNVPTFEDLGKHFRAIAAIGRQDIVPEDISPLNKSVRVLGASSDHLLLGLPNDHRLKVGDIVKFIPGYGALLRATTSPYVHKVVLR